jgi:hypothetical protein
MHAHCLFALKAYGHEQNEAISFDSSCHFAITFGLPKHDKWCDQTVFHTRFLIKRTLSEPMTCSHLPRKSGSSPHHSHITFVYLHKTLTLFSTTNQLNFIRMLSSQCSSFIQSSSAVATSYWDSGIEAAFSREMETEKCEIEYALFSTVIAGVTQGRICS